MATTRTQEQIQADITLWKSRIGVKTTCSKNAYRYIYTAQRFGSVSSWTSSGNKGKVAFRIVRMDTSAPVINIKTFKGVAVKVNAGGWTRTGNLSIVNDLNNDPVGRTYTANDFTVKITSMTAWADNLQTGAVRATTNTDQNDFGLLMAGTCTCNLCGAVLNINATASNWVNWDGNFTTATQATAGENTNNASDGSVFRTAMTHGQMIQYPTAASEVTKYEAELLEAKFRDLGQNASGIGGTFNGSIATAIPELTTRYNDAYTMGAEAHANAKWILDDLADY